MPQTPIIPRRIFLGSSLAVAAAGFAAPAILRGAQSEGKKRPVRLAVVGMGSIAGAHISWVRAHCDVTVMCDADLRRIDPTSPSIPTAKGGLPTLFPKALRLADYRELFRDHADKFDAVLCCSTDHHHYPVSMLALRAGKPIYCEKPLTWSVAEALDLRVETLQRRLPTQLGNQGISTNGWCDAEAHLLAGNLGELTEVHGWVGYRREPSKVHLAFPRDAEPVPSGLDWDLWSGPAPLVPFSEGLYHPRVWRYWMPFGSGLLGDWGCHVFGGLFKTLDLPYPSRVEVVRHTEFKGDTFPRAMVVKWTIPATVNTKPLTIYMHNTRWEDPEWAPPRPPGLEPSVRWPMAEHGCVWTGTKASYVFLGGHNVNGRIVPEALRKELGTPTPRYPKRRGDTYFAHGEEFVRAVRGEIPWNATASNYDYACRLSAMVQLGRAALLAGHPIAVDSRTGWPLDPADRRYCRREQPRAGWPTA